MSDFAKKVRSSSIFALSGRILDQVFGIIITWILIKKLSLEDFGIYNLLLGLIAYISISSSLGTTQAAKRYLPEFFHKQQIKSFLWTLKASLLIRSSLSLLSISIIALLFNILGPFLQISGYYDYYILFGIGVFFLLQARLLQRTLESLFLHKYIVITNIVFSGTRVALLTIVLALGNGLKLVLVVDIIAYLILLVLFIYFFKFKGYPVLKVENKKEIFSRTTLIKRLIRYSGFSSLNDLGKNFLDISTDLIVISHFLGPIALGYYAFAARIGKMASRLLPSRMMRSVVSPTFFARYGKSGDKRELSNMFNVLLKINVFIMLPILTLIAILGREIIQFIFDSKYLNAYPVLLILLIHFLMLAFPVALPLKTIEKPEIVLIGKFSSIYNLVMDIILIQYWGILGVAVATTSSIFLKKIFEFQMSKKYAGIKIEWNGLAKIVINCIVIAIIAYWIQPFVDNLLKLLTTLTVSLLIYFLLAILNKSFIEDERALINKFIGKKIFVF